MGGLAASELSHTEPEQFEGAHRQGDAALVALGVALALPYLALGPGLLLDDWIHARNLRFDGWVQTAGYLWQSRPGAAAVFASAFGLVGANPVLLHLIQTAVVVVNALAFRRLLARFVTGRMALSAAAVWLLLPIRSATDHWAATLNIVVATAALLIGLAWLTDAARGDDARWVPAGGALLASTLCYEAGITIALAGLFIAWFHSRRTTPIAVMGASIIGAGGWMFIHSPKVAAGGSSLDYAALPAALFGPPTFGQAAVVAALGLAAAAAVAYQRRGVEAEMMSVGVAIICLAAVVFVRFRTIPDGIGDRILAVMSFGVAMVLAAALLVATGRRVLWCVALAIVLMMPARLQNDREYAWAADEAVALIDGADVNTDGVAIVDECPTHRSYVVSFLGWWDVGAAIQFRRDDRNLRGSYQSDAPVGRVSGGRCADAGL